MLLFTVDLLREVFAMTGDKNTQLVRFSTNRDERRLESIGEEVQSQQASSCSSEEITVHVEVTEDARTNTA